MLIDYYVSNFRSIYKEQSFNMIAVNSYKEMEDSNLIFYKDGINLLKSTAIYGPNASGKSTLLESLDVFRDIVLYSSTRYNIDSPLPVKPFAFSDSANSEPTTFELTFVEEGIKYNLEIVLKKERILEEYLTAYPKGQPQQWYSRFFNEDTGEYEYEYSSLFKGQKKVWEKATKKNALYLSTAINLQESENGQLSPVHNWFKNKLTPVGIHDWSDELTKEFCMDVESKNAIVRFLKAAGIDIEDIELKIENKKELLATMKDGEEREALLAVQNLLLKNMPEEVLEKFNRRINVEFVHSNGIKLDLKEQSDGTRKLFAFASLWLESLRSGNVLFCDELNDNLHPALVKLLVDMFNSELNKNNAQLIFTTHETSILSQEILRRDQVWFCERDENLSTRVYPLSDFKPRKDYEDIENSYLTGRYGAIPYFEKISFKMSKISGEDKNEANQVS
jgi:hypothetical protein